ncbi:MAG: hypothetical protein A4E45_00057 [Methanosaeta sp. PtaB.Bin039]|nr:MAG: hypothetical protein A4E45_00057 [Methanosaeta sp. PtaB.Bin039]
MCVMTPWLILVALLLAITAASAETITVGNYSMSFEYDKPHSIQVFNETNSAEIQVFNGRFQVTIGDATIFPTNDISSDFKQFVEVNGERGVLAVLGDFFLYDSLGELPLYVGGRAPTFDIVDFLRSLKITPVEQM